MTIIFFSSFAKASFGREVLVNMNDFISACASVGPSMQRGFQVQVEQMNWDDVGGLKEVKKVNLQTYFSYADNHISLFQKLKQAIEWPLLYKESFARLGLKAPRGILLYGPPGCSKTSLVKVTIKKAAVLNYLFLTKKVIAASTNIAFLSINGAQLYSPFVGDSEKVGKLS